uniref:Secreted protein n=1 Tax=Setaria viridis TaxID=4556 RepID=A0A4U6US09_SETVI|nr:hypothetical protein SEVIR_5G359350v2 [Setaria viridis]
MVVGLTCHRFSLTNILSLVWCISCEGCSWPHASTTFVPFSWVLLLEERKGGKKEMTCRAIYHTKEEK